MLRPNSLKFKSSIPSCRSVRTFVCLRRLWMFSLHTTTFIFWSIVVKQKLITGNSLVYKCSNVDNNIFLCSQSSKLFYGTPNVLKDITAIFVSQNIKITVMYAKCRHHFLNSTTVNFYINCHLLGKTPKKLC